MKLSTLVVCLCISVFAKAFSEDNNYRRLIQEIETSNVVQVEKRLEKLEPFTKEIKENALEKAQEILFEKEERVSLRKSPKDAAYFASGLAFAGMGVIGGSGLLSFYRRAKKGNIFQDLERSVLLTSLMTIIGLEGARRSLLPGWRCSTAEGMRDAAKKVKELIESKETTDKQ